MDRKWVLASACLLPNFSYEYAPRTLRCSWQMRELSHLLTCGGVEGRPGRGGGRAVSTSLSRRWIAHAVAIYHWRESGMEVGGPWLDVQSPCYPLTPKSAPGTRTQPAASSGPRTRTRSSLSQRSAAASYVLRDLLYIFYNQTLIYKSATDGLWLNPKPARSQRFLSLGNKIQHKQQFKEIYHRDGPSFGATKKKLK